MADWRTKAKKVDSWRDEAKRADPVARVATTKDRGIAGEALDAVGEAFKEIGKSSLGIAEVGLTAGTSGATSIATGAAGALNLLLGGDPSDTADAMEEINNRFTYIPRSERGQDIIETISPTLMKIEEGADEISWTLGMGNPYAATLIKTSLLGGAELILPTKSGVRAAIGKREILKKNKEIAAAAKEAGVNLKEGEMAGGIVELAKKMTPEQRAQNAPLLNQAMVDAADGAKRRKDIAYEEAARTRTYIDSRSAVDLSDEISVNLQKREFDLEKMPRVSERLEDLRSMKPDETGTRANLSELERVRKRINNDITDLSSKRNSEYAALLSMKKEVRDFVDNEFNNIAINEGSALSGDMKGVQAWNNARELNREWKKNFSEDRAISQLINKESTPEQYRQWIMGATAMNARKEAALTINRMKEVLGNNHPAIQGVRQDFLFEVAEPLLKLEPNFAQFNRNYDAMIRKNPEIVRSLGLKEEDLAQLYRYSQVQARLPKPSEGMKLNDVTKGLAQFFTGHEIAKSALRVNLSRNIANFVIGTDRVSQKQIMAELFNLKYGEALIPKAGPVAAQFIAAESVHQLSKEKE